jgi:predicted chitinase
MPTKVENCTKSDESECYYFGRGPIQLTWYTNYKDASQAIFKDDRLVKQPWLVSENGDIGWATALWFWIDRGCHKAINDSGDFGATIKIINGNQECGAKWGEKPQTRVNKYLEYCKALGVDPGKNLKC